MELQGGTGFSIPESREEAGEFALVPADTGACDVCWRNFGDPLNRRDGYTPLHYLLFSDSSDEESEFTALVMTSGNLSEEPVVVTNDEAMTRLDAIADWFLLHNRDIATRVDDSVVRLFEGCEHVLRRSRGFVPQAMTLVWGWKRCWPLEVS